MDCFHPARPKPNFPQRGAPPVYDSQCRAIFYTPAVYPTIPAWLQPPESDDPDTLAAWQFKVRQHDAAYEPLAFVYEVPLTAVQSELIEELLRLRVEASKACMTTIDLEATPLFVFADNGIIRAWKEVDTAQLLDRLTDFIRGLHPEWRAVSLTRLAKSFDAYYTSAYGLDPVYAAYISGRVADYLARPVHYSLVRASVLRSKYTEGQAHFREALERECALVWEGRALPLPRMNMELPPSNVDLDAAFGSWRCTRVQSVRRLIAALVQMTSESTGKEAHSARVVLLAVLLQVTTGLRPFEVVALQRRAVDLPRRRLTLTGKPNPAYETHRQVPVPQILVGLLQQVLVVTDEIAARRAEPHLLWIYENEGLVPLQVETMDALWRETGQRAGLQPEQVPDLYGLRHFFRSRALERNMPLYIINALMGHQVAGCELYNPFLEYDSRAVFEAGQHLAEQIAVELSFEGTAI